MSDLAQAKADLASLRDDLTNRLGWRTGYEQAAPGPEGRVRVWFHLDNPSRRMQAPPSIPDYLSSIEASARDLIPQISRATGHQVFLLTGRDGRWFAGTTPDGKNAHTIRHHATAAGAICRLYVATVPERQP